MIRRYFSDLWLLLMLHGLVGWNSFREQALWKQALQAIGTLMLGGLGAFTAGSIGVGLGVLQRREPQLGLAALLPELALTVVGALVLFSEAGLALGSLLLADDLETLMTAPVDRPGLHREVAEWPRAVLRLALLVDLVPLTAFGLTIRLWTCLLSADGGAAAGAPAPDRDRRPAGVVGGPFRAARRVREVLGLVGALVGMSCGLFGQTSRFWAERVGSNRGGPEAIFDQLNALAGLPLPSLVAGRGTAAVGAGEWAVALGDLAFFVVLTLGFFAACLVAADRLYAVGWVRMQGSGNARRSRARATREGANVGWLGRAPVWAAIALKDWRVIPRDLRNFAQLLSPLLLLPVIYLNLLGGRRGRVEQGTPSVPSAPARSIRRTSPSRPGC